MIRSIRAEDEVSAPLCKLERQSQPPLAASVDGDRRVPMFPTVAVGAVMHAAAVKIVEAGDNRHFIDDTGGQQQGSRAEALAVVQGHRKGITRLLRVHNLHAAHGYGWVAGELFAR